MMKRENLSILHVTDLHFNRIACEWLGQQTSVDVICISGDLFDDSVNAPLSCSEQAKWYRQFFKALSVPVYICSGNHDIEQDDLAWQTITEHFDTDFEVDEFGFIPDCASSGEMNWVTELAAPNTHIDGTVNVFKGWKFGCACYGITDYARFRDCDVLLTHVPPTGTEAALQAGQDWGCAEIEFAFQSGTISPKYLLCGHVHRPRSHVEDKWRTTIINPGGSAKGSVPKHKVIHLLADHDTV